MDTYVRPNWKFQLKVISKALELLQSEQASLQDRGADTFLSQEAKLAFEESHDAITELHHILKAFEEAAKTTPAERPDSMPVKGAA